MPPPPALAEPVLASDSVDAGHSQPLVPRAGAMARARVVFERFPRQYWLMVVGIVISNAGGSLVWPYLLIFASGRLGLPLAAVGSLITIQAVAGMAASFVAGSVADRLGRKFVMAASLSISGCIYVLLVGAHGYLEFAILMALFGLGNPLYQVGADAMLADLVPSEQRAEAYAINRIASNAGFGLGPAIGGFLAATSYSLAFYGASLGFLVYALLVIVFARETLPGRATRASVRSVSKLGWLPRLGRSARPGAVERLGAVARRPLAGLGPFGARLPRSSDVPGRRPQPPPSLGGYRLVLADRRFVAFAALVSLGLIAPSTVWVLLAVYTKTNFGLPEYLYGWIPTANAIMCVTVQYPVTRFTTRFRPLPVVAVGMAVYAAGAGSVALMSSFPGFLVSMVVLTFGELIVVPTATKYIADLAPAALRGRYMGLYWLGWAASRAIAPLVGGALNDHVAPVAIWYGALVLGVASSIGLAALVRITAGGSLRVLTPTPDRQ